MLRKLVFVVILLTAMGSASADNNFRFSYDRSSVSTTGTLGGSQGTSIDLGSDSYGIGGGNAATLQSFGVQWDFSESFGVFYRHSKMSDVQADLFVNSVPCCGGTVYGGRISASGETFGVEGRYQIKHWLDLFGRINSSSYSVTGNEDDAYNLGIHTSQSVNQVYPSIGLRAKINQYCGLELRYDDYNKMFNPAVALGLYVQF